MILARREQRERETIRYRRLRFFRGKDDEAEEEEDVDDDDDGS